MALVENNRKINIVQQIIFVLLVLQMSVLFSYKIGIACLIITCLVSLATIVFIIIKQSDQISAIQKTLYQLCTQALIQHLENNPDSNMEDTLSEYICNNLLVISLLALQGRGILCVCWNRCTQRFPIFIRIHSGIHALYHRIEQLQLFNIDYEASKHRYFCYLKNSDILLSPRFCPNPSSAQYSLKCRWVLHENDFSLLPPPTTPDRNSTPCLKRLQCSRNNYIRLS